MKKAQMSLEMIIGLLILLVVAVVIIRMFLTNVTADTIPNPRDTVKYLEFKSECENLCSNFINTGTKGSLSKYCSKRLEGIDDLNKNSIVDSFDADTLSLKICEDAVYCFHTVPCKTSTGMITWSQCRQAICNAKYEVYKDWSKADEKVLELVPGAGTCELPPDENWWEMYFGSTPCTNPGRPPSEEFSINQFQSCQIDVSDKTYTCDVDYSGTCDPEDFIFMTNDTAQNSAFAAPGNDPPYGNVNFENNIIKGNLVMTSPLIPGNCVNPKIYCDINKDGYADVEESPNTCQIVQ